MKPDFKTGDLVEVSLYVFSELRPGDIGLIIDSTVVGRSSIYNYDEVYYDYFSYRKGRKYRLFEHEIKLIQRCK